mgnify:FL=1
MPNLISLSIKSLKNKIRNYNLKLPNNVNRIIISPGGCGTVTLKNFLDKFILSNNHLEEKFGIKGSSHIFKPPRLFAKNKIKVIIIKRNIDEIYQSLNQRGFLRNSLVHYGDLFPFMYLNLMKDKNKFEKKFLNYIKLFYSNWEKYPSEFKIILEYEKLYSDISSGHIIKDFFEINDQLFIKDYPTFQRYDYKKKI